MEEDSATSILRSVLALGRRLRAARPPGAPSLSAIAILSSLSRLGPMPATRLAAEERLQPQSLTRIIAGLEDAGWIARTRSPTDGRERSIAVTARGRKILADDMKARRRWLEQAMRAELTGAERAALLAAAEIMLRLAGRETARPPKSA